MNNPTFINWLDQEVESARYALITILEKRDKMIHIDGPSLEYQYMEQIGNYEESVIREEIECEVLQEKKNLIQSCINRRAQIDDFELENKVAAFRQQLITEAVGEASYNDDSQKSLDPEYMEKLQEAYHEIVSEYHPAAHPDLTEVQRDLYEKANNAYQNHDLQSIQLIKETLENSQKGYLISAAKVIKSLNEIFGDDNAESVHKDETSSLAFDEDYSLASEIYGSFQHLAEEKALESEWNKYKRQIQEVIKEMDELNTQFPYNTESLLSNPSQIQEYIDSLDHRKRSATKEKERLAVEVEKMLQGAVAKE